MSWRKMTVLSGRHKQNNNSKAREFLVKMKSDFLLLPESV